MFHQVDIPISAQIICEGQKIMIPAASLNIFIGPHTSVCMISRGAFALSPLAEKGLFVIFPSRQDSQTSQVPTFSSLKGPSFASIFILFTFM